MTSIACGSAPAFNKSSRGAEEGRILAIVILEQRPSPVDEHLLSALIFTTRFRIKPRNDRKISAASADRMGACATGEEVILLRRALGLTRGPKAHNSRLHRENRHHRHNRHHRDNRHKDKPVNSRLEIQLKSKACAALLN